MKLITMIIASAGFLLSSCSQTGSGPLFDGVDAARWTLSGGAIVRDSLLVLPGDGAQAVLKNGKYRDFVLTAELRTTPGGKGELFFHTDKSLGKGYRIAINNDRQDSVWWRTSGSLDGVRNLVKNFAREGEWFTLGVSVSGKRVGVDIDGMPVVEYIEPAAPYRLPEHASDLLSDGTFALRGTGSGDIEIRNIRVEALPEVKPAELAVQQTGAIDEQQDPIIRLHQADFPVLDYHVHLKGGLTREAAAIQSRRTGINYTIAPNCGIGFPISSNGQVEEYLDTMRAQPFMLAMQCEGREWTTTFLPETCARFDYVFTDALTFTDDKGRRTLLWIDDQVWIDGDQQRYMDMIVDRICSVLEEPADMYVNPNFLPSAMAGRYDEFWTEERMQRVVDGLVKSGKALEINELYQIPSKAFIQKAKAAGVKFTFGSNNVTPEVTDLSYSLRMKEECGLTPADMYCPKRKI